MSNERVHARGLGVTLAFVGGTLVVLVVGADNLGSRPLPSDGLDPPQVGAVVAGVFLVVVGLLLWRPVISIGRTGALLKAHPWWAVTRLAFGVIAVMVIAGTWMAGPRCPVLENDSGAPVPPENAVLEDGRLSCFYPRLGIE